MAGIFLFECAGLSKNDLNLAWLGQVHPVRLIDMVRQRDYVMLCEGDAVFRPEPTTALLRLMQGSVMRVVDEAFTSELLSTLASCPGRESDLAVATQFLKENPGASVALGNLKM